MIIGRVVGRLACNNENWNAAEIRHLPGGLGLQNASHQSRTIRLFLPDELELAGVLGRRVEGDPAARHAPGAGNCTLLEIVRSALGDVLADRRAARLDRENAFHQLRPRISNAPTDHAGLRMGEQDRRPDAIEQLRAGFAIDLLDHALVADGLDLAGVERIEGRVAARPWSGPLGVQARLRPKLLQLRRSETLLDVTHRRLARLAVDVTEKSGAATPGLVDDIDRITVGNEVVSPASAAVGRAEEVRPGLSATVDHHDRVGARLV